MPLMDTAPWELPVTLGTASPKDEAPKVWSGISIAPRRSMTLPASEEMVRVLGLKKGIRLVAGDLSGL